MISYLSIFRAIGSPRFVSANKSGGISRILIQLNPLISNNQPTRPDTKRGQLGDIFSNMWNKKLKFFSL